MYNTLKGYMYKENIFQNVLKYTDAITIYCGLFHLLHTVLNILSIHIYMVNILRGFHNDCQ